MPTHSETVTRAADLLRAAGMKVMRMQGPERIDADEHALIHLGLIDCEARYEGDTSTITGNHEDHGRVTLRREAGVFTVEAEDLSLVRRWGEPVPDGLHD